MKNKLYSFLTVVVSLFAFTACLKEDPNWAEGIPSPIISIEDVRDMYKGTDLTLTPDNLAGATQIIGVVISDAASGNIPPGTLVIQNRRRNNNRGIILSLGSAPVPFSLGDSVVVDVAGSTLTNVNGAVQITNLSPAKIIKAGENKTVRPTDVTIEKLLATPNVYEGTLVRVGAGTINPVPVSGETYRGDKKLDDGSGSLTLHTEQTASFATRRLPASASFLGIFMRNNPGGNTTEGAGGQLWLRNAADVTNASGPIYAGWPENFDALDASAKSSYNMNTAAVPNNQVTLSTGPWMLFQSILGNTGNDRVVTAPNSIRMQQDLSVPALIQMNFDVPNGATKVNAWVGSYGASADKPALWKLEYSQDQGKTWIQTGEDKLAVNKNKELITFLMDVEGPVRFRIFKYGPGNGTTNAAIQNGRLSVDDFAIYENPK